MKNIEQQVTRANIQQQIEVYCNTNKLDFNFIPIHQISKLVGDDVANIVIIGGQKTIGGEKLASLWHASCISARLLENIVQRPRLAQRQHLPIQQQILDPDSLLDAVVAGAQQRREQADLESILYNHQLKIVKLQTQLQQLTSDLIERTASLKARQNETTAIQTAYEQQADNAAFIDVMTEHGADLIAQRRLVQSAQSVGTGVNKILKDVVLNMGEITQSIYADLFKFQISGEIIPKQSLISVVCEINAFCTQFEQQSNQIIENIQILLYEAAQNDIQEQNRRIRIAQAQIQQFTIQLRRLDNQMRALLSSTSSNLKRLKNSIDIYITASDKQIKEIEALFNKNLKRKRMQKYLVGFITIGALIAIVL